MKSICLCRWIFSFWIPAARGGLHHKGAGRTLCAPTKRTSPPDGLIRLAALGTWPYPRRGPMRTSAPTNGADHVGQGLRRPPLTARPPSVTACGGATSPARGEAFLRGRMELATTKGSAPCGRLQSLPPTGGKVAFAQQMTDEGAEGRTVHYPRWHPHQSRFARQLPYPLCRCATSPLDKGSRPPGRGKPLWSAPMGAPGLSLRLAFGQPPYPFCLAALDSSLSPLSLRDISP